MKLRCEHSPFFLKRELGFLFGFTLAVAILLIQMGCATSSVIKMPKPLPDIVKSYKSVYIHAGSLGMKNTGVEVKQGDYITILAKGTIDFWPKGGGIIRGPKGVLSYKSSEKDWEHLYLSLIHI